MAVFWMIGQGKDLIVAFTENRKARWFFFLALVFWVYLTWYSSRIVAYMKKRQQENYLAEFSAGASLKADPKKFALPPLFLDNAPRILGFGCFLVLELAIFQVPLFNKKPLSGLMAFVIFIIGIILFGLFDRRVARLSDRNQMLVRWLFRGCVLAFLIICGILTIDKNQSIWWLLVLLILLHFAFLFAINLRRKVLEDPTSKSNVAARSVIVSNNIFYRVMNTFWIPAKEINYYTAFVIFIFAGLLLYGLSIFNFRFSVLIGPLPFVLLAFTALLAVGNLVTSFSIKYSVNFHLILILLAVFLGLGETHRVKTYPSAVAHPYANRLNLDTYVSRWVNEKERSAEIDSGSSYPVYFVLANGGASRSGYWTASVLGMLEDTTRGIFSRHLLCLSGASGGSVGNATFFALLKEKKDHPNEDVAFRTAAADFLKHDFLTYTLARMLGPDYFQYIFHIALMDDRAAALEYALERGCDCESPMKPHFENNFSHYIIQNADSSDLLPILCINTTRMQDGRPGLVMNIAASENIFNRRVDVLNLLEPGKEIHLSTAVILGARFPYVSPAGRIDQLRTVNGKEKITPHYFVDGGYFDNSGAGVVQEMIREIILLGKKTADLKLKERIRKLHFVVIHVTNSPLGDASIEQVASIKNDLAAPLLTLAGAYDQQTTVNDGRLRYFLNDIDSSYRASYEHIPLYYDSSERRIGKMDTAYAMNWFISDTTLKRMKVRLDNNPHLSRLILLMPSRAKMQLANKTGN